MSSSATLLLCGVDHSDTTTTACLQTPQSGGRSKKLWDARLQVLLLLVVHYYYYHDYHDDDDHLVVVSLLYGH